MSMPSHALYQSHELTPVIGLSYTAVQTWNEVPDNVVGVINDEGSQSLKAVLIPIF